jgi:hypothetical protein
MTDPANIGAKQLFCKYNPPVPFIVPVATPKNLFSLNSQQGQAAQIIVVFPPVSAELGCSKGRRKPS